MSASCHGELLRAPLARRPRWTRARGWPDRGSRATGARGEVCPRRCATSASSGARYQTLAAEAATQWTGTFNPRPFDEATRGAGALRAGVLGVCVVQISGGRLDFLGTARALLLVVHDDGQKGGD